jgi:hypothetical protein
MRREINAHVHMQEEEQQAAEGDLVGLRTDTGLPLCHTHTGRREKHKHAWGC